MRTIQTFNTLINEILSNNLSTFPKFKWNYFLSRRNANTSLKPSLLLIFIKTSYDNTRRHLFQPQIDVNSQKDMKILTTVGMNKRKWHNFIICMMMPQIFYILSAFSYSVFLNTEEPHGKIPLVDMGVDKVNNVHQWCCRKLWSLRSDIIHVNIDIIHVYPWSLRCY